MGDVGRRVLLLGLEADAPDAFCRAVKERLEKELGCDVIVLSGMTSAHMVEGAPPSPVDGAV